MNWQKDVEMRAPGAATLPPPAMIEETGWDLLLALHSNPVGSLDKLAAMMSVDRAALGRWLVWLEDRRFVAGSRNRITGELRAVLTAGGRKLLDRYLSATAELDARAHH